MNNIYGAIGTTVTVLLLIYIYALKNSIKNTLKLKELQYKLTDSSNPKDMCIEVIFEIKDVSPELNRLYEKIKNLY